MRTTHVSILAAAAVGLAATTDGLGAIGCTLNNPARDLKALFPEMTSYREDVKELSAFPDGRSMYAALQARVGHDLDPIYEGFDTPYTLYSVFQSDKRIGYVHGVNVPGLGGVIQVFLAVDPTSASIRRMVFQRLESLGNKALRARETREQFIGLSLADFYKHAYYAVADPTNTVDKVAALKPPATLPAAAEPDWNAALRGVRKNLILLDFFVFARRHEPWWERAKSATPTVGATHGAASDHSPQERDPP